MIPLPTDSGHLAGVPQRLVGADVAHHQDADEADDRQRDDAGQGEPRHRGRYRQIRWARARIAAYRRSFAHSKNPRPERPSRGFCTPAEPPSLCQRSHGPSQLDSCPAGPKTNVHLRPRPAEWNPGGNPPLPNIGGPSCVTESPSPSSASWPLRRSSPYRRPPPPQTSTGRRSRARRRSPPSPGRRSSSVDDGVRQLEAQIEDAKRARRHSGCGSASTAQLVGTANGQLARHRAASTSSGTVVPAVSAGSTIRVAKG